jgi:hypothetical protein
VLWPRVAVLVFFFANGGQQFQACKTDTTLNPENDKNSMIINWGGPESFISGPL